MKKNFNKMGSMQSKCIPFFKINPTPTGNDFIVIGKAVGCGARNVRVSFDKWKENNDIYTKVIKTLEEAISNQIFLFYYFSKYGRVERDHNKIRNKDFRRFISIDEAMSELRAEFGMDEEGNVIDGETS